MPDIVVVDIVRNDKRFLILMNAKRYRKSVTGTATTPERSPAEDRNGSPYEDKDIREPALRELEETNGLGGRQQTCSTT